MRANNEVSLHKGTRWEISLAWREYAFNYSNYLWIFCEENSLAYTTNYYIEHGCGNIYIEVNFTRNVSNSCLPIRR